MSSKALALTELLVKLFSEEELRRFLADDAFGLHGELPGAGATLNALAFAAAEALQRRDLADRGLFDRLEDLRPQRTAEIRRARGQVLPDSPLEPGVMWCSGRYRLDERLGAGGFGEVWRATEVDSGTYVALKILHPHLADDRTARTRFVRGAQALARLRHPGLVAVHCADGREGARLYCVMDLVRGTSMAEHVAQADRPRATLLELVGRVGEALAYVHSQGLVHRDVGPHNILVTLDGQAKLADFDLVSGEKFATLTTQTGIGTLPFLAPELLDARGEPTPAADVYGLAMTALFVLVDPERWSNHAALYNLDDLLASVPGGAALRDALRAALHRDPRRRTQRVQEFCAALRSAVILPHVEPATVTPEFGDDGALRLWSAPLQTLPQHLADAGIEAWPAEAVLHDGARSPACARIVPYLDVLVRVATIMALRGHRAAWLGITRNDTAVLVFSNGRLVLHDSGPPSPADLALARQYAPAGMPAAIVDAWPADKSRDPNIAVLAQEIRRGVEDDPRWHALAKFTRSTAAHDAFELQARVPGVSKDPVVDVLLAWAAAPPSIAALRGPIGSGRTHSLQLFAAKLAHDARINGGTPVVLASARGWRAPLRLSEVLAAAGHTKLEIAAIRFAVAAGECILLIDDLDAPARPISDHRAYTEVADEIEDWAGDSGRILVASSPACPLSFSRTFDLATPIEPAIARLADATAGRLPDGAARQIAVRLGTCSLLQLPRLGRALIESAREHSDLGPARLFPAVEHYLQSWAEHASLHTPDVSAKQHRLALEAVAASVWRHYPGLDGKALTASILDEILHDVCGASGRSISHVQIDDAILTTTRQNTLTGTWLAAERDRLRRSPLEPHRSRAEPDPDALCFAHNTILEVLLAMHLTRELAAGRIGVLAGPRPSPNVCVLARRTPLWQSARVVIEQVLTSEYHAEISENAVLLTTADPTLMSTVERPWHLSDARLSGAALRGARLIGCRLERARLDSADLRAVDLTGARLGAADLSRADLRDATLDRVGAEAARFTGSRLDGVRAREADLRGSSLFASTAPRRSPDLTGADLTGADLEATLWSVPIGVDRTVLMAASQRRWSTVPGSFGGDAGAVTELLSPRSFGWVQDVAWTPDGRALVSIDSSGHIVVWNVQPLRPLRRWKAATFGLTHVALSADGRLLATWTEGQAVRLWDMSSSTEVYPGALAGIPLLSAAWARTSAALVLFASDGTTWLWDPAGGAPRGLMSASPGPAIGEFLPGDAGLLRVVLSGVVEILDAATDRLTERHRVNASSAIGFAVSPDGRRIALKDFHRLWILDRAAGLAAGPALEVRELATDPALDWTPDGGQLVVGYSTRGPAVWNIGSRQWSHHLESDQDRWQLALCSPDGARVVGVGPSGDLALWDLHTGRQIERTANDTACIESVALSPDRRTLLACSDSSMRRWSFPGPAALERRRIAAKELVYALPDASGLVLGRPGSLVVADLRGATRRVLDRSTRKDASAWYGGHFTCDGNYFVCRVADDPRHEVAAWELASGRKVLARADTHGVSTRLTPAHTVDMDHAIGVSAGQDRGHAMIELWRPDTIVRRLEIHEQQSILQLAADAHGMFLVSAPQGPTVTLWDLPRCVDGPDGLDASELRLATLTVEGLQIELLRFAPQGSTLAVACGDMVSLFDAATQTRTHRLDGHGFRVRSLAFSADGRFLVVGDWSGQLRIWRVDTGALIVTAHALPGPHGLVTRGPRHGNFETEMRGWHAQIGEACIPLDLFDGALAAPDAIAWALARELEIDGESQEPEAQV